VALHAMFVRFTSTVAHRIIGAMAKGKSLDKSKVDATTTKTRPAMQILIGET